jgi:hypothetical protein
MVYETSPPTLQRNYNFTQKSDLRVLQIAGDKEVPIAG